MENLDKIYSLLTISTLEKNIISITTIYTITSLMIIALMFLAKIWVKNSKSPYWINFLAFIWIILTLFILFQINGDKNKQSEITIKNGFYQNIKNQNIVIQDYFSVKEREMIKFCLEKHEKETDFYICLKKLVKEEQSLTDLLKTKENNQEIINQFNVK